MSQCKVNKQNREQILARYIDDMLADMDVDALIDYARSGLEADYNFYTNEELENEIEDCEPKFEWEEFDFIDE
jgi:predicted RNA-binding protein Jag